MVERRPVLDLVAHVVLLLGVIVIALPVIITFVASTQTATQIESGPMSLLPGTHLIDNYRQALIEGGSIGSRAPVGRMMAVSLVMALGIAFGKIEIGRAHV